MRNRKQILAVLLAGAMAAGTLAGCGAQQQTNAPAPAPAETPAEAEGGGC